MLDIPSIELLTTKAKEPSPPNYSHIPSVEKRKDEEVTFHSLSTRFIYSIKNILHILEWTIHLKLNSFRPVFFF